MAGDARGLPRGRVYAFFRRWREHGLITEFHDRLRGKVRKREGREAEPTAGIIDAQSVRAAATVSAASRGYDGGKKVPGRSSHPRSARRLAFERTPSTFAGVVSRPSSPTAISLTLSDPWPAGARSSTTPEIRW